MLTEETRKARARLASTASQAARRPGDLATARAVEEARRNFRFVSATEYVRRLVDEAPPLTPEQRDKLVHLLTGRDHA